MSEFEKAVQDAIAAEDIPGCVLVCTDRDGSFSYAKPFGSTSMKTENAKPLGLDTVMWVASCTKLLTSLSCLQLVERGLLALDDPIYKHIPELEFFTVIKNVDEGTGKPVEEKHSKPITLRLLLTHSSGLTYDMIHPLNVAYLKYHGKMPSSSGKVLERYPNPLVFEPGESWMYSSGIDYAGLLVERVTGQSLEEYMRANIWDPLGIKDMTFYLSKRPDMKERLADMSLRDAEGKVKFSDDAMPYLNGEGNETEDCFGGHGIFTSAEEYVKVLQALLRDDEKILKKDTLEQFFTPQLGERSRTAMNAMLQDDWANNAMGGTPKHIEKDWGLGGLLLTAASDDGTKAGTMLWGGLPNLTWWVDRTSGLCALYAGQVMPTGDPKVAALRHKFEAEMYKQHAANQGV